MNNIPIVIPSYKNREGNILKDLNDKKYFADRQVIVYVYKAEEDLYKQYNNLEIRTIDADWRSIVKKRHYIYEDIKNNYPEVDYFWWSDDDVNMDKIKHKTGFKGEELIDADKFLEIIESQFDPEKDAMIGAARTSLAYRFSDGGKGYSDHTSVVCRVLMNMKLLRNTTITYEDNDLHNEDVDFCLQCLAAGYQVKSVNTVYPDDKLGKNSVASSCYKDVMRNLFLYKKWGEVFNISAPGKSLFAKMPKSHMHHTRIKKDIYYDKNLIPLIDAYLNDASPENEDNLYKYLHENEKRKDAEYILKNEYDNKGTN